MNQLVSPGVNVTVTDESNYSSPGTGTIPLILVATEQDKRDPTDSESDGIAKYTKKINANKVVPVTSQRELTQFFGDPQFSTTEGDELNEYGLLNCYSYLGQGSQAYVVRADVDLGQLKSLNANPQGPVNENSYWLDIDGSNFGVHVYDNTVYPRWKPVPVKIYVDLEAASADVAGTAAYSVPTSLTGVENDVLVVILSDINNSSVTTKSGLSLTYFRHNGTAWEDLDNTNSRFQGHFSDPSSSIRTNGNVWVKTTRPGDGLNLVIYKTDSNGVFNLINVSGVKDAQYSSYIQQDGIGRNTVTLANIEDDIVLDATRTSNKNIRIQLVDNGVVTNLTNTVYAQNDEPMGNPADGTLWFNDTKTELDILIRGMNGWERVPNIIYGVTEPATGDRYDVWVDTSSSDSSYPKLHLYAGGAWREMDNTDQTNMNGVLFDNFTNVDTILPAASVASATAANPIVVTTSANHGFENGDIVTFSDIASGGMTQLNGNSYRVSDKADTTFELQDLDGADIDGSSGYTAQTSASGTVTNRRIPTNVLFNDDMKNIEAPDYQLYPCDMLAVNMARSKNTVRQWKNDIRIDDSNTASAWVNATPNNANGSGVFGRLAQHKVIATRMQASIAGNEDLRDPARNYTLLCAPNFPELTDELVTLNSDRGETGFIIIDAPMRKTPTEAVSWIQGGNNADENGEDGLVTKNTYSAAYYPAGRSTAPNGQTVTVPPSHMALYTYAYNDNVAYPWFAPAGLTRGVVRNASAVGHLDSEGEFKAVTLSQGQRDSLYINNLNPIASFPNEGVVIFGQKSLHPTASALDRVNVARLVAYLKERFDDIARPLLFEQNDPLTQARAVQLFSGFLSDLIAKRALDDFAVVCDASNNLPARVQRNELWIDTAILPTKSVEFVHIPIRIVNAAA